MRHPITSHLTLAAAAFSLILFACKTNAEIYKWVDADGNTHFTDKKPPAKSEEIKLRTTAPQKTPDAGEIRRRELVERVQLETKHRAEMEKKRPKPEVQTPTDHLPKCKSARHRWYALTQEMPVYWTELKTVRAAWHSDTYKGQRAYISDKERPSLQAQALKEIESFCPNGEIDDEEGSQYADWLRIEECLVGEAKLEMAKRDSSRTTKSILANLQEEVRELCNQD